LDSKEAICFVRSHMQCAALHESICLASYSFIVQQTKIQFLDRLLRQEFFMGVREKIKSNIRNNLNREYFRRLLGILARKPILYAYGSTFSSIADKYLNIYTIENIRDSYDKRKPVVFGSLFLPYELFHALDTVPFLPEVMAGFTAGLGLADQTLKKASSSWYSQDLCTFHRSASGAVEMDLFPDPAFIICTNLACDAAQKSFYHYSVTYGIEKNYHLLDVPYDNDPDSIKYLAGQLEKLAQSISNITGKDIDREKMSRTIELSNELREYALKINNIRKELRSYPGNFNGLNFILPFHGLIGTENAVKLYKSVCQELESLLKKQKEKDPVRTPKKILWMHLKPYYKTEIFDIIARGNCIVAAEEINNVYWSRMDPEKPYESLAKKMLSHPLTGKASNRIKALGEMLDGYGIDGGVLFTHWGCRQSNGSTRLIKDYFNSRGIPVLVLDGDCVDRTNSSEGQVNTRLQGFIEILGARP